MKDKVHILDKVFWPYLVWIPIFLLLLMSSVWKYLPLEYQTGSGVLFGGVGAAYFAFCVQKLENRRAEIAQVNTALAVFENARITLLRFWGQLLKPYRDSIKTLSKKHKNDTIDKGFLLDNPPLHTMLSTQMFYEYNYVEKLAFMVGYDQELFVELQEAFMGRLCINENIEDRNKHVREFIEKTSPKYVLGKSENVLEFLKYHSHYSTELIKIVYYSLKNNKELVEKLRSCLQNNYWISSNKIQSYEYVTGYEYLIEMYEASISGKKR